jgi:hypothetical protein
MIDAAAAALGGAALQCFADDLGDRSRGALDRTGQRVAAERAEPNVPDLGLFVLFEGQAVVVDHDQHAVAVNYRSRCGKVKRDDWNSLLVDVEPDVELGPIRQWEHPHRLALAQPRVVKPPELGPLVLWVPGVLGAPQREDAFLGAALLLVAPRAAERGVK